MYMCGAGTRDLCTRGRGDPGSRKWRMGCLQTKVDHDPGLDKLANGSADSGSRGRVSSGHHSSLEDPRLPLLKRDIFKLHSSWRAVRRNQEETGTEMFIRLFKSNSELKKMFHAFKDLQTDDEMRSNEALENHATLVMTTLDDAITHIDDFDYVTEVLRKTGASHVRFEGFRSDNFYKIRDPFLEAVKITLGDRYTDNMESIYKVAITFILQTMCDGMEEALKHSSNIVTTHSTKDGNSCPALTHEENS